MAYATLAELRRTLTSAGTVLPTADDDLLTIYLADAQLMIDGFCHRTFEASADSTKYFDALQDVITLDGARSPNRTLWLAGLDLCAITSITNGDGTTISASNYVTEPRGGATPFYAITLKSGADVAWTYDDSPEAAIAIVGRWAYSTSADALIRGACLSLAAWAYRQRSSSSDADRPLLTGDGATILPTALPKHVYQRLAERRRVI